MRARITTTLAHESPVPRRTETGYPDGASPTVLGMRRIIFPNRPFGRADAAPKDRAQKIPGPGVRNGTDGVPRAADGQVDVAGERRRREPERYTVLHQIFPGGARVDLRERRADRVDLVQGFHVHDQPGLYLRLPEGGVPLAGDSTRR